MTIDRFSPYERLNLLPSASYPNAATSSTSSSSTIATSKSNSWLKWAERRLPFRLRISWKVKLFAFVFFVLFLFFSFIYFVLTLTFDDKVAAQRAFRNYVVHIPLAVRRHRFEEVLASALLTNPLVNHAVDELLNRVATYGDAIVARSKDDYSSDRKVDLTASTILSSDDIDDLSNLPLSSDSMLRVLFGTKDRAIAGSVGMEPQVLRQVVHQNIVQRRKDARRGKQQQQQQQQEDENPSRNRPSKDGEVFDLDVPNLREKMTALYVATMQPISPFKEKLLTGRESIKKEDREYVAMKTNNQAQGGKTDEDNSSSDSATDPVPPALSSMVASSEKRSTLFPLSLFFRRELQRFQTQPRQWLEWQQKAGLEFLNITAIEEQQALEISSGALYATHTYIDSHRGSRSATSSANYILQRKCFIPFFVPKPGPVRECRCVDVEQEAERGCRRMSDDFVNARSANPSDPESQLVAATKYFTSADSERNHRDISLPLGTELWTSDLTANSITVPRLSRREFLHAFPQAKYRNDEELLASIEWNRQVLPWVSGAALFDEVDSSVPSVSGSASSMNRVVSLLKRIEHNRFVAGPSSTTDAFLHLATFMGLGSERWLYLFRLALIAYLVPAYDHSILEILAASDPFGLQPSIQQMVDTNVEVHVGFSSAQAFTHLIPKHLCFPHRRLVSPTPAEAAAGSAAGSAAASSSKQDSSSVETRSSVIAMLEGLNRGLAPTALQHRSYDIPALNACLSQRGSFLTRNELNDAISLKLLQAFSPMELQILRAQRDEAVNQAVQPAVEIKSQSGQSEDEVILSDAEDAPETTLASKRPQQRDQGELPQVDMKNAGLCSAELAWYWHHLGLDQLHSQHQYMRSTPLSVPDGELPPCDPTLFLQWLTRIIYQY